jgi:Lipocalin-like domain
MHRLIATLGIASLIALPAHADSIKAQIIGAWSLIEGGEQFPDGKQIPYWDAGQIIFTPSGQYALILFKDRPKSESGYDPRYPVGPIVAHYGRYTVDEDAKTLTYYIDTSSTPASNGVARTQSIQVNGDTYITISPPVKLPQGEVNPVNQWRRVK